MKSTSLLDSHFSIFIEAFAVYKIKQKHCSNGGNAACSFRKSEWEREANITFPGYLPESNFTSHQHYEGEINLNVCHILESGMKYW